MAKRACIFCGSEEKLTSSHVVARRFLQELPGSDEGTRYYEHNSSNHERGIEPILREMDRDPREEKPNVLCGSCNGQWMSTSENAIASILIPMAKGEEVLLGPAEQEGLVLWATIAAMVRGAVTSFDHVSLRDRRFIRTRNQVPDGYKFWVIHGEDRLDWPTRFQPVTLLDGRKGWTACLWVGQAIFIVASPLCVDAMDRKLAFKASIRRRLGPGRKEIQWPLTKTEPLSYQEFLRVTDLKI